MTESCASGNEGINLLYACSGGSNLGFLADSVGRKMMKTGAGKMTCLAGIGGGLDSFIESAKTAGKNIVLDGCAMSCGKKIFDNAGLPCVQFVMTDFGAEKGKTEITQGIIDGYSLDINEKIKKFK